jgi:hypothetical protein
VLPDSVESSDPEIAFEKSRSSPLALRPHESTSKVPFSCRLQV